MNADQLLAHYEQIADTPDAIPRLRRFILDLAVRGKLVPQDPNDEPASELLKRIEAEKARLVKAEEIKKQKPMVPVLKVDQPFDLPYGWSATRLATVTVCLDYMRKPINEAERALRISGKSQSDLFPYFGATQQQGWIDDYIFDEELVLLGEDGVPFFEPLRSKAYLIKGKSWVNNHAHVFRGIFVSHAYLVHWLNVFDYSGRVVGATRAKLNQARALDVPIMLPPLTEQHRIIAKVDELMALCDQLDVERKKRETTRDRLVVASLARLNTSDPTTFREHASFALNNLASLTNRADQVQALRQTILDLAVRGKLVPQDPGDGEGKELLPLLKKARIEWESAGRIRKQQDDRTVDDAERYLDTPKSWTWAKLYEIGQTQTGTSPSSNNADLFGDYIPFIKPGNMGGVEINYDGSGLSKEGIRHSRFVSANSILMVCIGATLGKVNKTTRSICFNQQINSLTVYLDGLADYIVLALKSSDFQELAWSKAGTGTLPIISKGKWEVLPIPLPPLAEQYRIVAKVDELMGLCDRLEASLAIEDDTRCRLLDALLHEALEPDATPDWSAK